ncbi:MAG: C1 family peptidase [Chloroflexi bacterium]|nr:C1 family peptidase [Chloroflexota bacterium]
MEKPGTPLLNVSQIKPSVGEALHPLWITTVEELVTTAFEEKGGKGLARLLKVKPEEVKALASDLLPLLPQEIRVQLGTVPRAFGRGALDTLARRRGVVPLPGLPVPKELPPRVSLLERLPEVRDQGRRGTCVAHACLAVREYLLGDRQIDLSEQFLYWAARQEWFSSIIFQDRPGALLANGMAALQKYGVCPEADWPYNPTPVPGDEEQGVPPTEVQEKARAYRIQRSVPLLSHDVYSLKAHLAGGYPIAFTVPTFNYWTAIMVDRTGAIRLPMSTEGTRNPIVWLESAHALCLAGYEDDPSAPGGGYFIVRNSWGSDWGRQCPDGHGHGWLPYAYLQKYGLTAFTAV